MNTLLNIINHALLDICRIVREHSDAADGFLDDGFVAGADSLLKVLL